MPYHVTVETWLGHSVTGLRFYDAMQWHGLGEEAKAWLAASCHSIAMKLVALPEVVGSDFYTVSYRTVVREGEKIVSDTTKVEFQRLSYSGMCQFRQWAVDELREMIPVLEGEESAASVPTRPRSALRAIAGITWQVVRNKLSVRHRID